MRTAARQDHSQLPRPSPMRNRRASVPSPARPFDPRAVLGFAVCCVVLGCRPASTAPHSHSSDGDWPVSTPC
jgi:hypothetical protein